MFRRRQLLIALASGPLLIAKSVLAQQPAGKIPRIGVLWHAGSAEEEGEYFTTFMQGFRELGYVEGKNIVFEHTFAGEQYDRFKGFAEKLVALKVDVLVAVTGPAARAVQPVTRTSR